MMGDALRVAVDDMDPTPPYEQIRQQLAALVRSGALLEDQRLPAIRQLASDLGLAVGTVARAYQELEAAGLLVTRRGAGTRVAALAAPPPAGAVDEQLFHQARRFVRNAVSLGADAAAVRRAVERALDGVG